MNLKKSILAVVTFCFYCNVWGYNLIVNNKASFAYQVSVIIIPENFYGAYGRYDGEDYIESDSSVPINVPNEYLMLPDIAGLRGDNPEVSIQIIANNISDPIRFDGVPRIKSGAPIRCHEIKPVVCKSEKSKNPYGGKLPIFLAVPPTIKVQLDDDKITVTINEKTTETLFNN